MNCRSNLHCSPESEHNRRSRCRFFRLSIHFCVFRHVFISVAFDRCRLFSAEARAHAIRSLCVCDPPTKMGCGISGPTDDEIREVHQKKYETYSHNGAPVGSDHHPTAESVKLHGAINSYPPSSADSTTDEPSGISTAAGLKWRCIKASIQNDINDDPCQFTPLDELPKGKLYVALLTNVRDWMTALNDPGTANAAKLLDKSVIDRGADSLNAPDGLNSASGSSRLAGGNWSMVSQAGSPAHSQRPAKKGEFSPEEVELPGQLPEAH